MKKDEKENAVQGLIIFLFGLLVVIIINAFIIKFDYRKNGKYGIAEIYDFHVLANSSHSVCYKFLANNQQHSSCEFEVVSNSKLRLMLIGKKFPVIYNPEEPEESVILITKYDFEHYNLDYPDSLKWVEDYR